MLRASSSTSGCLDRFGMHQYHSCTFAWHTSTTTPVTVRLLLKRLRRLHKITTQPNVELMRSNHALSHNDTHCIPPTWQRRASRLDRRTNGRRSASHGCIRRGLWDSYRVRKQSQTAYRRACSESLVPSPYVRHAAAVSPPSRHVQRGSAVAARPQPSSRAASAAS